jgi:hypothetical protein
LFKADAPRLARLGVGGTPGHVIVALVFFRESP